MDAVQFLMEEHQKVRQRFAEIEQAGPDQRLQLWRALEPELKIHEEIEDTYLYGPVGKDPAAQGTDAARFEEHQDKDVAELQMVIAKLHQTDPHDAQWMTLLRKIRDSLMDHVQEEEGKILPQIQQIWSHEKLAMSGQQMAAAKQEAMTNPQHYATMMGQMTTQSGTPGGTAASMVSGVTGAMGKAMDAVKDTLGMGDSGGSSGTSGGSSTRR